MTFLSFRDGECFLWCPAGVDTVVDEVPIEVEFSDPTSERQRPAVDGDVLNRFALLFVEATCWQGKCFFDCIAAFQPRMNSCHFEAGADGPICNGERFALESEQSVSAGVVHLLLGGGPATVDRFIVSGVVDSVKGVACWSWSHIGYEVAERKPAFADNDSASAVAREGFEFGVVTPLVHVLPGLELSFEGSGYSTFAHSLTPLWLEPSNCYIGLAA
jgi:hypothetical protein